MEHREEISEGIMNLELMLTPPFFKAYLPLLRNIKAPAQAKWILLYLLDRQAMKRWPVAHSIIGQDVGGLSPSTVRRMVDKLIGLGLVKVIDRKRDGMVYQVQLESGQNDQSQTDEPSQFHGLLSCKSESGQIDHSRVATLDTITDKQTYILYKGFLVMSSEMKNGPTIRSQLKKMKNRSLMKNGAMISSQAKNNQKVG
jgi:hypothetical protein